MSFWLILKPTFRGFWGIFSSNDVIYRCNLKRHLLARSWCRQIAWYKVQCVNITFEYKNKTAFQWKADHTRTTRRYTCLLLWSWPWRDIWTEIFWTCTRIPKMKFPRQDFKKVTLRTHRRDLTHYHAAFAGGKMIQAIWEAVELVALSWSWTDWWSLAPVKWQRWRHAVVCVLINLLW